jgi:hypothetical protein
MQKRHQDAWTRWQRLIHEQQAGALGLNYPEFPDSCLLRQFVRGVNVSQVLTYGSNVYPNNSAIFFWLSQKLSSSY